MLQPLTPEPQKGIEPLTAGFDRGRFDATAPLRSPSDTPATGLTQARSGVETVFEIIGKHWTAIAHDSRRGAA